MDGLRVELFSAREKRAAAIVAVAALLIAASVLVYTRPPAKPNRPAPVAAGSSTRLQAAFTFISPNQGYAIAGHVTPADDRAHYPAPLSGYRTTDGARTWQRMQLPTAPGVVPLAFQPLPGGGVVVTEWDPRVSSRGAYWLSPDGGGAVWRRVWVPDLPERTTSLQMLDALSGVLVSQPYYNTGEGSNLWLYWTHDAGASWEQVLRLDPGQPAAGGLDAGVPYTLPFFDDLSRGWMVSAGPGLGISVLRTGDGGRTWRAAILPGTPVGFSFGPVAPVFAAGGDHGYLALDSGAGMLVYESWDAGATWARPYPAAVAWFAAGVDRWVSLDGAAVLVSRDWGRTWASTRARLPAHSLGLGRLQIAGSVLWSSPDRNIAARGDPARALLRSADGGRTFVNVGWPGA